MNHENADENTNETAKIILVVGETGVGKSHLINAASGANIKIGHNLKSCTEKTQVVECEILKEIVFLIDTPGFDDTYRSDAEILEEITKTLCSLYKGANSKICGVIYIHKISETRMKRSALKNILLFRKLCGDDNLNNVVLLTNRWDTIDYETGLERENELKNNYWREMIDLGCKVDRYTNKQDIKRIFNYLLPKKEVVLDIQKEMVDEGRTLEETSAGNIINEEIIKIKEVFSKDIQMYKDMIEELRKHNSKLIKDAEDERSKLYGRINKLENDLDIMAKKFEPKPSMFQRIIDGVGKVVNIENVFKVLQTAGNIASIVIAGRKLL